MKVLIFNSTNPKNDIILESAVKFFAKTLLPKKYKNLTINIMCNEMISNSEAETVWVDTNLRPNVFEIKLSRKIKNYKKILQALAHEMVHVKQFAKNEIYDYVYSKKIKWNKKVYDLKEHDYWDLPWEIEAFGKETGLYCKYKNYYNVSDDELQNKQTKAIEKINLRLSKDNAKSIIDNLIIEG